LWEELFPNMYPKLLPANATPQKAASVYPAAQPLKKPQHVALKGYNTAYRFWSTRDYWVAGRRQLKSSRCRSPRRSYQPE
jgi:hypothetical protein